MTEQSMNELQLLLEQERQRSNIILNHISEGVIQLNAQFEIEDINATAESLCECEKVSVLHRPIYEVFSLFDEKSQTSIPFSAESALAQQKPSHRLLVNQHHHQRLLESFFCILKDNQSVIYGYLFIFRDITQSTIDPDQLQWQASHDNLTGLVNRQEMEARIEKSLQNVQTHNIRSVFLMVDIDQFTLINKNFGHNVGDEYLQRIALQMLKHLRARDTLSRIGGDRFGILLENCLIDDAAMIANKIKTAIGNYRFIWGDKDVCLKASVGLLSLTSSIKANKVIDEARSASMLAKSKGGDQIYIHQKNKQQLSDQRQHMSIIASVNRALDEGLFCLYFQPIYSVEKQQIAHWEVLIRLVDQDNQVMSPSEFLPAAEKYGLIAQLDDWVIEHSIRMLSELNNDSLALPHLAINLSPSFLEDKACRKSLVSTLNNHSFLQNQLIFEITETSAFSDIESINRYLSELKQFGCRLALDDFGTGVSTYSYLKQLDIDMIKIDGEFIENIHNNAINQEIVRSLIKIAHMMSVTTTAEWVCDEVVYHYLNETGMDFYQGYFISEPLSQEEFIRYLRSGDEADLKRVKKAKPVL